MTDRNKLLAFWKISEDGQSVPLSHNQIKSKFSAVDPSVPAQENLDFLRCEDLVMVNCYGEYELTPRGCYWRKQIQDPETVQFLPPRTGHEWDRFRKLLNYYVVCVQMQEYKQDILSPSDLNREYLIPSQPFHWLRDLDPKKEEQSYEINVGIQADAGIALNRLLARTDDDEEMYLGYPISFFPASGPDEICYSPVSAIPVDLINHSRSSIKLRIRLDETSLNQNYFEYNFRQDKNAILNQILNLHKADSLQGMIDLRSALPLLQKNQIVFDADDLQSNLPSKLNPCKKGVCNIAILFVGQPLKYSKTLKKELKYIRDKISDQELDTTAQAYVFREPVLIPVPAAQRAMPIPFISANQEQMTAIENALNLASSKVSGPPGTGKSQVAVNIIANFLLRGKSVLFTSKNNKAVAAITEKSRQVFGENISLPLVNFCCKDCGTDNNAWYQQDLDQLKAYAYTSMKDSLATQSDLDDLQDSERKWTRQERNYGERKKVRDEYTRCIIDAENLMGKMHRKFSKSGNADYTREDVSLLKKHVPAVGLTPKLSIRNLPHWLHWYLGGKKRSIKAMSFLQQMYPDIFSELESSQISATLFEKYHSELKQDLSDFCDMFERWEKCRKDTVEKENILAKFQSVEDGTKKLNDCLDVLKKHMRNALIFHYCQKIGELEKNPDIVNRLKSIMTFLRNAKTPFFFQLVEQDVLQNAMDGFKLFSGYFPAWATTLLSLTKVSPCVAGLFDTVIVDESSQCDIPPVIPALFRAKSVVLIGDPNQFPPVIDLPRLRNDFLKTKYRITDLEDQRFDFLGSSAYDLLQCTPVMLREHFRCAADIAEFCNDEFYAGKLKVMTNPQRQKFPAGMGYKNAVSWIDIKNSYTGELDAVHRKVRELLSQNYPGSIGVITPFREHADKLKQMLYGLHADKEKLEVDTVNAFQGGERDVIFLVLGLNDHLDQGHKWYIKDPAHRYIYNVAISRARAVLFIIGDKEECAKSDVPVLRKMAQMPLPQRQRCPEDSLFDSIWEKRLFDALLSAGIKTAPQYPLVGRRLDLALIDEKIDIEVDGAKFHFDSEGERNTDDLFRDLQVMSAGWTPIRFLVKDLRDDMPGCLQKIRDLIKVIKKVDIDKQRF